MTTPGDVDDEQEITMNDTDEALGPHVWDDERPISLPHGRPVAPIDGKYAELAKEVRRLLGWYSDDKRPFLSTRDAARKTGLSNSTISNITKGDRVSPDNLQKFAVGVGGDVTRLMALAGYIPTGADPFGSLGVSLPTALFLLTPVEKTEAAEPNGLHLDDVLRPAGTIGDRVRDGLLVTELQTDALRPDFVRGDILFIRKITSAQDGRKVIVSLPGGRMAARLYHAPAEGLPYLSNLDGSGPLVSDGFSVHGIIEYYLRRA